MIVPVHLRLFCGGLQHRLFKRIGMIPSFSLPKILHGYRATHHPQGRHGPVPAHALQKPLQPLHIPRLPIRRNRIPHDLRQRLRGHL